MCKFLIASKKFEILHRILFINKKTCFIIITCCNLFCFRTMLNKPQKPHCQDFHDNNVDTETVQHNIYNMVEMFHGFSKIPPTYFQCKSAVYVYAYSELRETMYHAKILNQLPVYRLYLKTVFLYRFLLKDFSTVNLLNKPEKAANKLCILNHTQVRIEFYMNEHISIKYRRYAIYIHIYLFYYLHQ